MENSIVPFDYLSSLFAHERVIWQYYVLMHKKASGDVDVYILFEIVPIVAPLAGE